MTFRRLLITVLLGISIAGMPLSAAEPAGAFLGAKETDYPDWFKQSFLDFNDDIAEASAAGKRLLLLFYQPGCPYCSELVNKNLAQKDIETTLKEKFDVVALNMWGDRELVNVDGRSFTEKQFAELLKVQFTPTLLFFSEAGQVVLRLNGYVPPARFSQALAYVSGKGEASGSFREFQAAQGGAATSRPWQPRALATLTEGDLSGSRHKPLAVFFEQSDCPACDTLHDKTLRDADTQALLTQFDIARLDMWSMQTVVTPSGDTTTAAQWAQTLGIQYAPTIVLFNPEGVEVIRSEAFFKTFHTQSIFDYVLSDGYRDQPSFQRYISARAEHIRDTGRDVNIWE